MYITFSLLLMLCLPGYRLCPAVLPLWSMLYAGGLLTSTWFQLYTVISGLSNGAKQPQSNVKSIYCSAINK